MRRIGLAEEAGLETKSLAAVGQGDLSEAAERASVDEFSCSPGRELCQERDDRPLLGSSRKDVFTDHVEESIPFKKGGDLHCW
jgi:hypothetical protein